MIFFSKHVLKYDIYSFIQNVIDDIYHRGRWINQSLSKDLFYHQEFCDTESHMAVYHW